MPEQLRDIKDVIYIFDWGTFLFFLMILLAAIATGYFLFKFIKRRYLLRKTAGRNAVVGFRPIDEVALDALMKIDPVEYFEKRKIKEFYFEITEIVRQFLTGNYHIDTMDKTSLEIIGEMERVERDFTKVKNLDAYFSECDLVKFAKLRPGIAEMKLKRAESEKIIREFYKRT
ncbi:MAG TPA: hypothetical protein VMU29_06570 [Smithella sp.]|nr:hypothetical protein [Smithella sp.]